MIPEVANRIHEAGTRPHWIYQHLPRASCRFCVLASRSALVTAVRLDPAGAAARAQLEERMGHQFRAGLSMHDIITAAAVPVAGPAEDLTA